MKSPEPSEGRAERRILITGGTGQVGHALTKRLAPVGQVIAPSREQLDLASADSIRAAMREWKPRWVVNPGAYTAVDKAESEPELAFAINAKAPEVFAEEALRIGAGLIHFSTDYVFDGSSERPYVETDRTNPLGIYGSSKLAAEKALAAIGAPHLIFRTSWVYGATGKNFLLTILRLARERESLRIVGDQHGAPTWSDDLARMTAHAIAEIEARADGGPVSDALTAMGGVYHASGQGETTWYGFALDAVARLQAAHPELRLATIEAISTAEYPTPAQRPKNSRLNCEKAARVLGWRMPRWQDSLERVLAQLEIQ